MNTTDVVHTRATFNWDNTGAEYYRIRVNTGSGWSILTQIGAADGFAHPNASKTRYFLSANTTYEWQVRGWCLDGSVSNWSASATFSTLGDCPNATNHGATNVEGEWATMTWDSPFSSTSHNIVTSGMTFSPSSLTVNAGDAINVSLGGYHNMVEVDSATWASGGSTALAGGFNFGFGECINFLIMP